MRKKAEFDPDSQALHEAVTREMRRYGRGALTLFANECGMTPSGLRKRLLDPGTAFDGPTLRAVLLVMELRKNPAPPEPDADIQAQE